MSSRLEICTSVDEDKYMTTTTAIRPLNTDREIRRWAREDARRRKQTVTSKATRKMLRGDW